MAGKQFPATFPQLVCVFVQGRTCLPIVEFLFVGKARTKLTVAGDGCENEIIFPFLHCLAPCIILHYPVASTFSLQAKLRFRMESSVQWHGNRRSYWSMIRKATKGMQPGCRVIRLG